ncbi:hypothetical protein [Streptomyces zhihengii]
MAGHGNDDRTGRTLPHGASGFRGPKGTPRDGPLPVTDLRAFRGALFTAARSAGGEAGEVERQTYPLSFHTAAVVLREDEHVVLCHAHLPWIAFATERRNWYTGQFGDPPPWASAFAEAGFDVLGREHLLTPLAEVDTSSLSRAEWHNVRTYGVDTLGGVLFNAWA